MTAPSSRREAAARFGSCDFDGFLPRHESTHYAKRSTAISFGKPHSGRGGRSIEQPFPVGQNLKMVIAGGQRQDPDRQQFPGR